MSLQNATGTARVNAMRKLHNRVRGLAAALSCTAVLMLTAACSGGPERAPHQPIQGADTENNEVDNPHDQTTTRPTSQRSR